MEFIMSRSAIVVREDLFLNKGDTYKTTNKDTIKEILDRKIGKEKVKPTPIEPPVEKEPEPPIEKEPETVENVEPKKTTRKTTKKVEEETGE